MNKQQTLTLAFVGVYFLIGVLRCMIILYC